MFFRASQKVGLELVEAELLLVPAFEAVYLDEELGLLAMRYIFAVYGYLSPYRTLPEKERINTVIKSLFKRKVDFSENEKMKMAIKVFNELQYDGDFNSFYACDEQQEKMSKYLRETEAVGKNITKIKNATIILTDMVEMKNKLMEILLGKVKRGEVNMTGRGGKEFTYAEERFRKPVVKAEEENN